MYEKKLAINDIRDLIKFIHTIDKTQNELYELSKPHKECQNEKRKNES
jgi:hypothetical protein